MDTEYYDIINGDRQAGKTLAPDVSGKKLRVLDGLEEVLWLFEPTSTRLALLAAEIEGATTVQAWQKALELVQQRYPLLSAHIRKIQGERPYFESLPNVSLPLRVVPYRAGISVDELIAQELLHSFDRGAGLLARVTLCHSSERTLVLFVAHHAACDGRTNVEIMCDLIAAASGETLGPALPLLPTVGELLGLPETAPYSELLPRPEATECPRFDLPAPKVKNQCLEAHHLSELVARARKEQTTLQGALVAAFILTGRHLSQHWQTRPIVCLSPIDLRPMLSLPKCPGCLINIHPTILSPSEHPAFWDFARMVKNALRSSQQIDSVRMGVHVAREVVKSECDPYDQSTVDPEGVFNHDLMVSNYGAPDVRTTYGPLKLTALYPSVLSGQTATQTISVITVNGVLHLNHVSREPITSLLEDSLALLLVQLGENSPAV